MHPVVEEKIIVPVLDLDSFKSSRLDESYIAAFAYLTKQLLKQWVGDPEKYAHIPPDVRKRLKLDGGIIGEDVGQHAVREIVVRGNPQEVKAYAKALGAEAEYLKIYSDLGPDDPKTAGAKAMLDAVTNEFERVSGLQWPFK